jgi:acetylornithine deacetylase
MTERIVSILKELIARNSTNAILSGGPGEHEIAGWIRAELGRLGFEAAVQAVAADCANVVARVPGRTAGAPVLLNGHIDTVAASGMPEAFTLRADGDRLCGRGAYDMKGSVAVMLRLAEHWSRTPPAHDVWLTFSGDEEDRSRGTEFLVSRWLPTLPQAPAAAVVLEPTEEALGVAHKGFVWFEVEVFGRAAHGSRPEQGVDAILPLRAALSELDRIDGELRARRPDPLLGCASLHGSRIEGGTELSVIPAHARLQWERRTLPDETEADVDGELDRVAGAVSGLPGGHTATGRRIFTRPPYRCPADTDLLRRLRRALPAAPLAGLSFWADSALIGHAGVPCVLFGPAGHGAHALDEWVSLNSLLRVYEVLRDLLEKE